MFYDKQRIKWLHVENTSYCNAWCPVCSRNKNGFGLADDLKLKDLSIDNFSKILNEHPNVETMQFCGRYGEPTLGRNTFAAKV